MKPVKTPQEVTERLLYLIAIGAIVPAEPIEVGPLAVIVGYEGVEREKDENRKVETNC
jgi:hypothetical protein